MFFTTLTLKARPVGINVQDSNTGGEIVTNTAFGIAPTNWVNLNPGGSGTQTFNTNGGSLTVTWNTYGTWYSSYGDGVPGDTEVYHGWVEFDPVWNTPPSPGQYYFTISGLHSFFTNGCVVQTVSADNSASSFQPVTITNNSETLNYSAWLPYTDDQIGGVSTVSTPITDDSITLTVPQGAWTAPGGYLQAGTLAGVILRDPPHPTVDLGVNFQENNTQFTGKLVTATAFGLPVDNWLTMPAGGSGSQTLTAPSGGSVTVNWSAGDWNTTFTDGVTGDEEVYYGWLDFGWGANSSYVTVSGLSTAFTNGYVVEVAASTDGGTALQPVTLNGGPSLAFSASQGSSGPLGGLSAVSSTMADDSVTFTIPVGSVGSTRASVSGVIFAGATIIQNQPQAPANPIYAGDSFSLSVGAIGASQVYQWRQNSNNITGATNATYSVTNASTGNSGYYDVLITSAYGSVTSSVVSITVNAQRPPTVATVNPASQVRYPGGSAYFGVTSDGSPPLSYQWLRAGSPIAGATNSTLSLFGLTSTDATNYSCLVSNTMGYAASSSGSLALESPLGYQSTILADGPLVYYRLSEPTPPSPSVAYDSGSLGSAGNATNFPGVLHQVSGAIVGDSDTAMEYSAIDTNSDDGGVPTIIPYNAALNTAGSFTIEAWLRPTENGAGNAQCPMFNRDPNDTSPNRVGWDFFQRDSSVGWNFRMFNGNAHDKVFDVTGGPYTVGQWCHLVAVYNASLTNVTLYLNGVPAAVSNQPNGTFSPNTSFPMSIGGYSDGSQNPFVGDIDEVALYTNALSAAQVLAHYQNGTNPSRGTPYSSLVLSDGAAEYLRLDEPATDVTANSGTLAAAANGTYVHTVNDVSGPAAPAYAGIESNNVAMNFNGSNSYVELDNPAGLNFSTQITLEAWVKPDTNHITSNFGDVIAHGVNDTGDAEVMMRLTDVPLGPGSAYYQVGSWNGSSGPSAAVTIPAADLSGSNWVYLVGTYDGANWNLYRNGYLVNSQAGAFGALLVSNANWAIGARGRWKTATGYPNSGLDRQFAGGVDEPAVYNYALTPQQVLSHYYIALDGTTNVALTIVTQPASQRVITNTTATFTVAVKGSPIPTYQWYEIVGGETNPIASATNPSYTTPPVQDSDSGTGYFVVASNVINLVTSTTAFLTAGHLVATSGYLENDEFFNLGTATTALTSDLYPNSAWLSANAPNVVEYLNSLEDHQDLPNSSGERIYGWFTPPASGDYIFFIASDDAAALWLSTNSSPANVYQIAQNQAWMDSRDWTCSDTGSGEYAYFSYGEWRSDQFELNGGPNAYASFISGWTAWPTFNSSDGGIPLVAGTKYYIELDHFQGGGGQNAAVTYKLAGQADPAKGAAPLLTGTNISALVPDTLLPKPQPRITHIGLAGSSLNISGNNGLVNAAFNVLTSTNASAPLTNWQVLTSARFDINGNFSVTKTVSAGSPNFYIIQVP